MAVDEALLMAAATENVATLRFYEWDEPTLSLGYFQSYEERAQHTASHDCSVVRRQSGGGAILHDRELTYSLTLPASHPLARNTPQLYSAIHQAIIGLLTRLTPEGDPAWKLSLHCPDKRSSGSRQASYEGEPFLCFERRAPGDIVMAAAASLLDPGAHSQNWKIVGSAQRRHHGAILQHGSLLLARSPAAPELPGYCDLTGAAITASTLTSTLSTSIGQVLGTLVEVGDLPAPIVDVARNIERDKYASESWTRRR